MELTARLVTVEIHLDVVADDGVTLWPVQVPPRRINAADWPAFDLDRVLAQITAELRGSAPASANPDAEPGPGAGSLAP